MREIKFRGKRIDNAELVYGNLIVTSDCRYIIQPWIKTEGVGYTHPNAGEVVPKSVGQYTGKQDEEKTDIYDGDKLYAKGNLDNELQYIGTVVWDNEDCRFEVVNYLHGGRYEWIPDGCVVRGSIHDLELSEGEGA